MADISDKVWAEYILMDYAPNIRKDPVKAKKDLTKFLQDTFCLFYSSTEPRICRNFAQNCPF